MISVQCPKCLGVGCFPGLDVDGTEYPITCDLCGGTHEVSAWLATDWQQWEAGVSAITARFERRDQ